MPNIGPMELIIILVLALLIFGPKKLPEMGQAIGKSITSFRKGLQGVAEDKTKEKELEEERLLAERAAELKRQELADLERELANRRSELNTQAQAQTPSSSEKTN